VDYGLAFIIHSSDFTSTKTAGTCRWTAPEVINLPDDELELNDPPPLFTMASDIYAFAMTVIEVYFLFCLFPAAFVTDILFVMTVLRSALLSPHSTIHFTDIPCPIVKVYFLQFLSFNFLPTGV